MYYYIEPEKCTVHCTVGSNDYYDYSRSLCIKLFWITLNILKLVYEKNFKYLTVSIFLSLIFWKIAPFLIKVGKNLVEKGC